MGVTIYLCCLCEKLNEVVHSHSQLVAPVIRSKLQLIFVDKCVVQLKLGRGFVHDDR